MTAVRLSDRQRAALLALPDDGTPIGGITLAVRMCQGGRETSAAGAHQAANGLDGKELAVKYYPAGATHIRYKLTDKGRELAAQIRGAA